MGRLSDILQNGDGDRIRRAWETTNAAGEFGPLPPGTYVARLVSGELFTSNSNATPGYKLAFRVLEGDYAGRQIWHDLWLTEAALPMTKRDVAKLGVVRLEQLEAPLPRGIRCSVKLALRTGDDGTTFNRVRSFEVIGIDPPDVDPFAPTASPSSGPPGADRFPGNGRRYSANAAPSTEPPPSGAIGVLSSDAAEPTRLTEPMSADELESAACEAIPF